MNMGNMSMMELLLVLVKQFLSASQKKHPIQTLFCEITVRYEENHNQTNLFHHTTKWQQIDLWLRTFQQETDPLVDSYAFLLKEQKTIIDDNQTISSVLDQAELVTIDIINRNMIAKVIFTYETNNQSVDVLKSIKISSLLNSKNLLQQLNLNDISSGDCLLVLEETNEYILSKDDLQQPVATYSIIENQSLHFRISISVHLIKYDDKEQIKIPLSTRNTTIEQLLQLKDIDENLTEFQFQMTCTAAMHCSSTCFERKIILPCREDTLLSIIVKESLEK